MPSIPPFNLKFLANRIDISGSIHALGQGSVGNDFEVGNELTVKNKIIADGDISANKDLIVKGKSTFNDDISMNGHLDARDASFNSITVQNTIYMGQALEVGTVKVVNDISCGTLNSGDVISIDGSFNRLLEVNEISGNKLTFSGSSSVNDLTVKGLLVLAGSFQLPPDLKGANIDLSENLIVSGMADISGHTLMKDVSATNLELSGNLIVDGTTDLSGNVNMGGNLDLSGNLIVDGNTDLSGNVDICGNLNVRGNYNFDGGYLTSHILPSVNSQYDLGSAERKIRHLFLSNNSLWIGDEHKIDVSEGKLRMKKRNKDKVPKRFLGEYNDIDKVKNTLESLGVDISTYKVISDVKLSDWYKLADYKDISGELFTSDDTGTGDDDFESDEKASKNVLVTNVDQTVDGLKTFSKNTIFNDKVGIGTSSPIGLLEIAGNSNSSTYIVFNNFDLNSNYNRSWRIGPHRSGDEAFQIVCGETTTGATTLSDFDNNNGMFTITTAGRVGIGTDEPGAKLDVNGSFSAGANGSSGGFEVIDNANSHNIIKVPLVDTQDNSKLVVYRDIGYTSYGASNVNRNVIVLDTNIRKTSNVMYKIRIQGWSYIYESGTMIDVIIKGYASNSDPNVFQPHASWVTNTESPVCAYAAYRDDSGVLKLSFFIGAFGYQAQGTQPEKDPGQTGLYIRHGSVLVSEYQHMYWNDVDSYKNWETRLLTWADYDTEKTNYEKWSYCIDKQGLSMQTKDSDRGIVLQYMGTGGEGNGTAIKFRANDLTSGNPRSGTSKCMIKGAKENATHGDDASVLTFHTQVDNGNLTEQMRISSDGNVGIGTTSPKCLLNTNNLMTSSDNTIPNLSSGINGNNSVSLFLGKSHSNNINYWGMWMGTIYKNPGFPSYIQCGDAINQFNLLLNPEGGNVGIGTTSPGAKLEIKGDALNNACINIKSQDSTNKTYEFRIRDDTTTSYPLHIGPPSTFNGINISDDGNVGIGTSSPAAPLSVCRIQNDFNTTKDIGVHMGVYNSGGAHLPNIQFVSNHEDGGWIDFVHTTDGNSDYDGRIRYDHTDGFKFFTNTTQQMTIDTDGNVGIGKTEPNYPLQVMNSTTLTQNFDGPADQFYFYRYNGLGGQYGHPTNSDPYWTNNSVLQYNGNDISIYCEHTVWARYGGFAASSDQRIKENIRDVSDNDALQKLRDISCCFYEYKDKINRGYNTTIGFIAQQVKKHMPIAVSLQKDIIPNEMRLLTDYSWNQLPDSSGNYDLSNNQYKLTIHDLSDNSGNSLYCFYVSNDPSGNDEVRKEIKSLEDEPNSFVFDQSWNNVFLYGKEVDDFHTLDKQKLFALNFSATQEIDRIQQAQQTTINNQQITINNQQTTINNQQTTINTLQTTIETLQNTLASFEQRLQQLESN